MSSAYNINDYPKWIAQIQPQINQLFNSKQALFREHIEETDFKIPDIKNYKLTARLLTFEIYLQQIFNRRYLTTEEFITSAK